MIISIDAEKAFGKVKYPFIIKNSLKSEHRGIMCMHAQLCPTLCDPMDCKRPPPLSMGFFGQEYQSGLLFPPPGDFPGPGIKPALLHWWEDSLPLSHLGIIKAIYDKSIAKSILSGESWEGISSKIRNKTRVPTTTSGTQHSIGSSSQSNQRRN